jgi:hypothetical protein
MSLEKKADSFSDTSEVKGIEIDKINKGPKFYLKEYNQIFSEDINRKEGIFSKIGYFFTR